MSVSEAPSSSSDHNPSVNESSSISVSHSKNKLSIRSLMSRFKAKPNISKPDSLELDHNTASTSATIGNNDHDDHSGGALALSNLIRQDLDLMKEASAEVQKYVDHVNVQINQACEKLDELQTRGNNSEAEELRELKKAVAKLKAKIPSQLTIRSVDSNLHRNPWQDANKVTDAMMDDLYKVPVIEDGRESEGILTAFSHLPGRLQFCLLHFFWFPTMTIIKKRVMIYLWMAAPHVYRGIDEAIGNDILEELIAKGFVEPVYQKSGLSPDCCRMSLPVCSALATRSSNYFEILPYYSPNRFFVGRRHWLSWLINVSASVIGGGPEQFEKMNDISILYLGRWQNSATHHIEIANTKILYGLKSMNRLTFVSLRGVSMITELPSIISELTSLKILDLRACHNLQVVPDSIGLLTNLTHLDMSECYFLEYMPNTLSNLSSLEVLKGFFIGDPKYNKRSCSLDDLSILRWLRKLNIYTSVKGFPTERQLIALQKFRSLRKLTISWGGCSSVGENDTKTLKRLLTIQARKRPPDLPFRLQKLDLQCFQGTSPPSWLRPANLKQLKKLYIRGGRLGDLGQFQNRNEEEQWNVETLCLKYLGELVLDWEDLKKLFPKLIYFQKVECPKLTRFPFDEGVEWMNIREGQAVARNGIMDLEGFSS